MTAPAAPSTAIPDVRRALVASEKRWGRTAAIRLLIEHGYWLHQAPFGNTIDVVVDEGHRHIAIRWEDAALLADAPSLATEAQQAVLRLACSLAGVAPDRSTLWSVERMLSPLDRSDTTRALRAITRATTGGPR